MVRRHGWQLPAHTLQVAAITVFFLLAIAYYIFFAPFLWFNSLVIAAYAVYSPLAFAVFILYVRCTGINPADPGVLDKQQPRKQYEKALSESSLGIVPGPLGIGSSVPSSVASSVKGTALRETHMEEGQLQRRRPPSICSCAGLCGLLCGWMVASDDRCRFSEPPPPVVEDEILFCTLCDAEVRKFSKHCRSCDKCVDGFDHHCRWLNNCIGKKNYRTFVALMSTSLMLLIVEGIVGIAVFVRCFVDRRRIMEQVMEKLGNGFTRAPFASVVAVCTVAALLACIPLGELFFFHLILIKKGITTYEYVVAVRAQPGESPVEEEVMTSTSGSTAPGMSRSSSLGLQQHGGWCTPPRIFVEHQEEAIPYTVSGASPTTIQPEPQQNNPQKSKPGNVRISAWRLAKLDKAEAARAAANARKASSVLRPIAQAPDLKELSDSEESYTSDSSRHSISGVSNAFGTPLPLQKNGEDVRSSMSLSPYKSELPRIRTGREPAVIASWAKSLGMELKSSDSQSDSSSKSSFVGQHLQADTISKLSISSILRQPEEAAQTFARPHLMDLSGSSASTTAHPAKVSRTIGATLSDGYEASAGETTDDMRPSRKGRMLMMSGRAGAKLSPASRPSFGGVPSRYSAGASNPSRALQFGGRGISTSVLSSYQSRPSRRPPSSSTSSASETEPPGGPFSSAGLQPTSQRFTTRHAGVGNLQINEPSIFFSSPLIPIGESSRRHLPPRPPVSLRASTGNLGPPGSSAGSNTRLVTMLPSQTSDPIDR